MIPGFRIRTAAFEDVPAISALIDSSVRSLQAEDYSPAQIEGALNSVFGVDSTLISDGTYFVAEADGAIVGCGGWSKRRTLFGGDQSPDREDSSLDPACDRANIRAFFVHPAWARKGIGSGILAACEEAAVKSGFSGFRNGRYFDWSAVVPGAELSGGGPHRGAAL